METKHTAYLIPHTHWDREWHQPFQVFRARLLQVIDRVLELLEQDPEYRRFTLDGQAIILEDYLELRPEKRGAICQQVQAGRLRIGPWYVLADEFLVSPEALIRNLMLGAEVCQAFGNALSVAYTPDSFGHISQLPLIVKGFGLDSIVFERGVGDEGERLRGEFRWLAADGETAVFAAHLLGTYSAATALGHTDWELRDSYSSQRAQSHMQAVLYGSSSEHEDEDSAELPAWFRESIARVTGGVSAYSTNGALILLNGSDHLFPQANIAQVITELNAAFAEVDFVHADVEEFIAAARQPLDKLATHRGEFRGSRYQHILSGVLSSRLYLKQANHAAETLLTRYAEPLAALAWQRGWDYPGALLQQAWRLLLHNHPHDSICGCSVDTVHREMMIRYDGVTQLGDLLSSTALEQLGGQAGTGALIVFNPLPYTQQACVTQAVDLPAGTGRNLSVLDDKGQALPCQLQLEETYRPGRSDEKIDRVTLSFVAPLPPLGVAGFKLVTNGQAHSANSLGASDQHLENRFLRLDMDEVGQLDLTDKASGHRYPLDIRFEDRGDAGDEYDFSPVPDDRPIILSLARAPELLEAGPIRATLRLSYHAEIPARLSADRQQRLGAVDLPLTLELSLTLHSPVLHCRVRFDNRAHDHRLRFHVATGCQTEVVQVEGHFDVLERPVRLPKGEGWFQRPQATNHQRRFVAASDGDKGLAVLNKGLPEYEAIPTENGVDLAVTLLRAVGWLSREDLSSRPQGAGPSLPTPEAQCLSEHSCELALYPFAGPWHDSGLPQAVEAFSTPPRSLLVAEAPSPWRLLELSPPLLLSALRRSEGRDSLIVRVWNPTARAVSGTLNLGQPLAEAYEVTLAELRVRALEPLADPLTLTVGPKAVKTLELVFAERGEAM